MNETRECQQCKYFEAKESSVVKVLNNDNNDNNNNNNKNRKESNYSVESIEEEEVLDLWDEWKLLEQLLGDFEEQLDQLCRDIHKSGIIRDQRRNGLMHPKVFLGSELITWMTTLRIVDCRCEAAMFGSILLKAKVIYSVLPRKCTCSDRYSHRISRCCTAIRNCPNIHKEPIRPTISCSLLSFHWKYKCTCIATSSSSSSCCCCAKGAFFSWHNTHRSSSRIQTCSTFHRIANVLKDRTNSNYKSISTCHYHRHYHCFCSCSCHVRGTAHLDFADSSDIYRFSVCCLIIMYLFIYSFHL
ncbi:hypothetical protein RFI_36647 [Reticulomyxa filosa]|uniref:DEP domain-containing protein n=1 Tax=Reticulomyxa filosa TaxID=46433 RepID=X6LHD7_RETFI|nr:hypothetical protein RFI_36647 [Reticulomyxa filosa]|eukprot:ETO00791.1 hypothetical protein RFI_36647 [Reticulomyxa filosa]